MRSSHPSAGIGGPDDCMPHRDFSPVNQGLTVAHTLHYPRAVRAQTITVNLTGSVVGGYRLERLLGGSTSAQVYFGRHAQLGRAAAIKILNPELPLDEEAMSRFF